MPSKPQRNTTQRRAILRAFDESGRPLSMPELHALAGKGAPKLGIATVYRTVRELVGQHALAEVKLPGQPSRYELAGKSHHHHFSCRGCGKVFELADCRWDFKSILPRGFKLKGHEMLLIGECAACSR